MKVPTLLRLSYRRRRHRAFSMVELMTVLAVIVILVTILIPVVSRVRKKAQAASVQAQISSLDAAIQRYYQDFNAYPGPLPRTALYPNASPGITDAPAPNGTGATLNNVTGAENLALGLLGGLKWSASGLQFDRTLMGRGPRGLNPANPKTYPAYIEGMMLSDGDYKDGAGDAVDSVIPEILDGFADPMPILYLRAAPGAGAVVSNEGLDAGAGSTLGNTQYDLREIIGYTTNTNGSIGEGKTIRRDAYTQTPTGSDLPHGLRSVDSSKTMDKSATSYQYPYDAFAYFQNRAIPPTDATRPNATGTPRNKDKYILISAGLDRVYGTEDDITNFGSVVE